MPLLNSKVVSDILSLPIDEDKSAKISVIQLPQTKLEVTVIPTKKSFADRIPAFGLLCAILSVVCWSLGSLIVKLLTDLHSIEILVIRAIFQMLFYGTSIVINRYPLFGQKGHRIDLALRALSGTIALSSVFMAYRLMPLSDASTIHFSSPVFVTVFAYFILKESFYLIQVITGVLTIIGVTIISKPEFLFGAETESVHEHRLIGTILSVVAAVCAAFAIICIRKLKTTPAAVVVFWFAFSLFICGSVILLVIKQFVFPTGLWTWSLLVIVGLLGIGDQYFLTIALHYESAGPVSVTRTFNIVLSFLWEVLILSEAIEWTSILGATIVSSCVLVLAFDKWRKEKPELFEKLFNSLKCHRNKDSLKLSKSLGSSTDTLESNGHQNTIHSTSILIGS